MKYIAYIIRMVFFALFIFLLINGKTMLWLGIFAGSLLIALIFGRIYCGYVCPMNTLMIPVEYISKKLKIQSAGIPKWLKEGYLTWVTLFVSVVAVLLSKKFLHINLPMLPFWVTVAVLVTFRYKPEVFHNLICPFGVLQRVFGRFAKISMKINQDACTGCRLCEKVCPSNAILVKEEDRKVVIDTSLCHQCINCRQVCPQNAVHYTP